MEEETSVLDVVTLEEALEVLRTHEINKSHRFCAYASTKDFGSISNFT